MRERNFQKDNKKNTIASNRAESLLSDLLNLSLSGDENHHKQPVVRIKSSNIINEDVNSRSNRFVGVYVISVAARLADMHPQTLRKYDKEGLVSPQRSEGSRRLYSDSDVERLRVIRRLADELGLNLNGVSLVLQFVVELSEILELLENTENSPSVESNNYVVSQIRKLLSFVRAL
ncbi:MAG: hypothetical protein CL740_06615 [Chloroflexi bacterium]|nr:hypothetical protein [Chloroflexota bacterium]|tara:strand:- start:7461 stop:7988 length:528 start_codon:yes stop_codon:yes gene_type:complete